MEVNQPDRGVFRGMGKLEGAKFVNRKYFPNIRNIHQFQYTHDHLNDYKTSFQSFRPFDKNQYKYQRAKKNTNESHVELGTDKQVSNETQARNRFRKYNFSLPPKPIKHAEEGIGINEYSQRTGDLVGYSTTSNENFNAFKKLNQSQNVKYKYTRTERFNPITGESKSISSFGFQDFIPAQNRNYKANNFTVMPTRHHEKYDIISGRKLTQF